MSNALANVVALTDSVSDLVNNLEASGNREMAAMGEFLTQSMLGERVSGSPGVVSELVGGAQITTVTKETTLYASYPVRKDVPISQSFSIVLRPCAVPHDAVSFWTGVATTQLTLNMAVEGGANSRFDIDPSAVIPVQFPRNGGTTADDRWFKLPMNPNIETIATRARIVAMNCKVSSPSVPRNDVYGVGQVGAAIVNSLAGVDITNQGALVTSHASGVDPGLTAVDLSEGVVFTSGGLFRTSLSAPDEANSVEGVSYIQIPVTEKQARPSDVPVSVAATQAPPSPTSGVNWVSAYGALYAANGEAYRHIRIPHVEPWVRPSFVVHVKVPYHTAPGSVVSKLSDPRIGILGVPIGNTAPIACTVVVQSVYMRINNADYTPEYVTYTVSKPVFSPIATNDDPTTLDDLPAFAVNVKQTDSTVGTFASNFSSPEGHVMPYPVDDYQVASGLTAKGKVARVRVDLDTIDERSADCRDDETFVGALIYITAAVPNAVKALGTPAFTGLNRFGTNVYPSPQTGSEEHSTSFGYLQQSTTRNIGNVTKTGAPPGIATGNVTVGISTPGPGSAGGDYYNLTGNISQGLDLPLALLSPVAIQAVSVVSALSGANTAANTNTAVLPNAFVPFAWLDTFSNFDASWPLGKLLSNWASGPNVAPSPLNTFLTNPIWGVAPLPDSINFSASVAYNSALPAVMPAILPGLASWPMGPTTPTWTSGTATGNPGTSNFQQAPAWGRYPLGWSRFYPGNEYDGTVSGPNASSHAFQNDNPANPIGFSKTDPSANATSVNGNTQTQVYLNGGPIVGMTAMNVSRRVFCVNAQPGTTNGNPGAPNCADLSMTCSVNGSLLPNPLKDVHTRMTTAALDTTGAGNTNWSDDINNGFATWRIHLPVCSPRAYEFPVAHPMAPIDSSIANYAQPLFYDTSKVCVIDSAALVVRSPFPSSEEEGPVGVIVIDNAGDGQNITVQGKLLVEFTPKPAIATVTNELQNRPNKVLLADAARVTMLYDRHPAMRYMWRGSEYKQLGELARSVTQRGMPILTMPGALVTADDNEGHAASLDWLRGLWGRFQPYATSFANDVVLPAGRAGFNATRSELMSRGRDWIQAGGGKRPRGSASIFDGILNVVKDVAPSLAAGVVSSLIGSASSFDRGATTLVIPGRACSGGPECRCARCFRARQ